MRITRIKIKTVITVLAFIFIQTAGVAQTNSKYWRQYHLFMGIGGGPLQTNVSNQMTGDWSQIEVTKENSISFSFDAGYFFSKYIGLSIGLGLSPYKTQLSLGNYFNTLDTIDSEGEIYERRIMGNDIKEVQRIHFLEVPLMLNLNYPYSRIIGLYFQGGVNLSIPFAKTYSSSGTFTYSGFYPAYNVLLTDLPYEGFVSNAGSDAEGELKIKTINPIVVAVAGFYFFPDKQISDFGWFRL